MEINKIYHSDCVELMKQMEGDFIDLTVTSPPYDNLRDYNDYNFDFEETAKQLYRVTKEGGVVVWVVGDQTIDGSETGTSFRQALYFKEIGFNLHDTMIYRKNSYPFPPSNRYYQVAEYMFVLSKGVPKNSNLLKQETKWQKDSKELSTYRKKDGTTVEMKYEKGKDKRIKDNIWEFNTGYMRTTNDKFAYKHPAMFPEQLAKDHILSWSNEKDLVFDPFCGAGTTPKMALANNRNFIACDISKEYVDLANRRIGQLDKNYYKELPEGKRPRQQQLF